MQQAALLLACFHYPFGVFVMSTESTPVPRATLDRRGRVYQPTVGPKLRVVLLTIFLLFALLGANSVYLASLKVMNWWTGKSYEDWFYQWMFLGHLLLGFLFLLPFVIFVSLHLRVALKRPNRTAVRLGLGLLSMGILLLVSGVLMALARQYFPTQTVRGRVVYWIHVLTPIAVIGFYVAHRLAGPTVKWHYAKAWGAVVVLFVAGFGYMHMQNPHKWGVQGADPTYFEPSLARTLTEDGSTAFIPAAELMNNEYCLRCHSDAYAGWFHSAHHFASFNNLAYRQSILDMRKALDHEVRQTAYEKGIPQETDQFKKMRQRRLQATRWCAGCHDLVPFFSGAFDDDKFFEDLEIHFPLDGRQWEDPSEKSQPTAHAGITCVSCHAITHIDERNIGNGGYTIQRPLHYPFAFSENRILQAVNEYLIKANPGFHKRTFLKPFHRTAEFCSICHKVHLPKEVNDYRWVRGQNHFDDWHSSGASGFGSRSFVHPATAKKCSDCHMPLMDSKDFGNLNGQIHNHLFVGANTALPALRQHFGQRNHLPPIGDEADVIKHHEAFLRDKKVRVDLFAVRDKGSIDGEFRVIRPELPTLAPGETYLLEIVVRNLGVGHTFTQGTSDSNEVWLQVDVGRKGQPLFSSGAIDSSGYVDPNAHFLNALILDRHGNRIDRRNAKDIFVPLFSHQVPPSGSQVVHYRLDVSPDQREPLDIRVQLKYRKFDRIYQDFFMGRLRSPQALSLWSQTPHAGAGSLFGSLGWAAVYEANRGPELPVVVMAEDFVTLPIQGGPAVPTPTRELPPLWERHNDYGVGLFLQGSDEGAERGLLKQAEVVFKEVARLKPDYADAYLNLARVYLKEGRTADMAAVLEKAREVQPHYWKTAWLRGELNRLNGRLDEAIDDFRRVLRAAELDTKLADRGFDFSKDREIRRQLGDTLYNKSLGMPDGSPEQKQLLGDAIENLKKVLAIDSEDRQSHWLLHRCYRLLGDEESAKEHDAAYKTYQVDDNARDFAVRTFRLRHPWADKSAQSVVIYELRPVLPNPGPREKAAALKRRGFRPGHP